MHDKSKVWSEAHGSTDDLSYGINMDDYSPVSDTVVKKGVVTMGDCTSCGRQWKSLIPWAEVASFYIGYPVPNTVPTRQGIMTKSKCPCGYQFRTILDWSEIQQYVDKGVRAGCLKPNILQARR